MEPLINVHVEEGFVFLAMRLLPEEGAQSVQPVKVTYASERPMVPLRLTAVAANPNMAVMIWFYTENEAMPVNYAGIHIPYEDLTFFSRRGRSNYRQLIGQKADDFGGQAFITEYAGPTRKLDVVHPLLLQLGSSHPYVTRLNTVISPEEMTVDPVFDYDPERKDVSNIHGLSGMNGLYDCESRSPTRFFWQGSSGGIGVATKASGNPASTTSANKTDSPNPTSSTGKTDDSVDPVSPDSPGIARAWTTPWGWAAIGVAAVLLVAGMVGFGVMLGRRSGR